MSSERQFPVSKITVFNNITLDGVMQAPGRADEDTRGGFTHGGWSRPFADRAAGDVMARHATQHTVLLFGRRTYEQFFAFWSTQGDNVPYAAALNNAPKRVASTTLTAPLAWRNATLLPGDAADALADLKTREARDFVILGSGGVIQSLMRRGLIDEFTLLINPVILGSGIRLFPAGAAPATLRLVDVTPTGAGVVIATYQPA
jgi:dihydrofolate reductase